ncbi:DUF2794 domain-containing protein [Polycladidibacter hongkongensis]|uniref:DUF2794 domain-containing protein n=1 Tax=Polycladidibacter hongkongensis TaxID=1647556 RepID=UPI0008359FDB|nr:DUF2794 domain-containing protein [Pseudovibrio hongkongensis]
MSDGDDTALHGLGKPKFSPASNNNSPVALISFHRRELDLILRVYGRFVASGDWRDYAIDHGRHVAVFSIYRHSRELPLYRVEKDPRLARKQGAYRVVAADGQVLKRGQDLETVLKVFERKKHLRLVD